MTKKQIDKKYRSMKKDILKYLDKEVMRLASSGAIAIEKYDNTYLLPKICLVIALENLSRQYLPYHKEEFRTINNLRNF